MSEFLEFFAPFAPDPAPDDALSPASADAPEPERPVGSVASGAPDHEPVRAGEAVPGRRWIARGASGSGRSFPTARPPQRGPVGRLPVHERGNAATEPVEVPRTAPDGSPSEGVRDAAAESFDPFGLVFEHPPERRSDNETGAAPAPDAVPEDAEEARHGEVAASRLSSDILPVLRSALSLLLARGHHGELEDRLDDPDAPRILVRFRPRHGPLETAGRADWGTWELRLAPADTPDPSEALPNPERENLEVTVGHSSASLGDTFFVLGRARNEAITPDWVLDRFVAFVQHTFDRS